jgi:hypothetical protein
VVTATDKTIAQKTMSLREAVGASCVLSTMWKNELLIMTYNSFNNKIMNIVNPTRVLHPEEIDCLEELVSQYIYEG